MFHLHIKEGIAKALFVAAAGISVLAVALICVFLFANGVPAIAQIGLPEFLFGTTWRPANDIYGIFPMIVGSIYVTAGAILVGVPTGLLCAIFLSRFASGKIAAFLKPGVELLAGIPSVVYGFFGLVMIVPFIRDNMPGRGLSLLAAAVLLGIMILPTIIPGTDPSEAVKTVKGLARYDSEMISTGTAKMFSDGVTEGGSAVMLEPYNEAAGKGSDWYGESEWDQQEFDAMVAALDKAGVQVHVHAIGDGAVRNTLNAFENAIKENGERADRRYTMTHVCAVADEDIKRIADLEVISALQFLWMYRDPLCELEIAYIGEERAMAMYPVKNMLEAGCIVSGASDGPVTPFAPLEEIEVAVTRNSPYPGEEDTDMHRWPEQAITPYQALEAYTKNVAFENFMEDLVGTIEVGKKADLAVLDQNILTCDPKKISDSTVRYTISDGRIVHEG